MKEPIMPTKPAEQDPKAWEKYWQEMELYELWLKNQKNVEYRKRYYAEKTKQRQIAKMKEFMEKYPDEAMEFCATLKP